MAIHSEIRQNALPVCLWKENPNRLVSLWDIVRYFPVSDVYLMLRTMKQIEETCDNIALKSHGGEPVPPAIVEEIRFCHSHWQKLCKGLDLYDASVGLMLFGARFGLEDGKDPHMDVSECRTEFSHILTDLEYDLESRHSYAHIVPERREYAFQDHLFGEKVSEQFPSARYDIREAGNCFAVDANTAAIFHLMRVAEYGLRALAYDRRVKVQKGPFDLATWEDLIKELERAENAIHGYKKTHAREAQFKFYHGVMMEVRSFKNIWRNPYAHTRAGFKEDDERKEAKRVMERVGDFMKMLSTRIAEGTRTPLIWKGEKWTTMEG